MAEVDLQKIQNEYDLMQKMFDSWNGDLDEMKDRVARVSAGVGDPSLRDYHERTLHMFDRTLARMQEMHDSMVEAAAASLKK